MNLKYAPLLALAIGCEPISTLEEANQNGIITEAQVDGVQKEADAFINDCKSLSTRNLDIDLRRRTLKIEIKKIKDEEERVAIQSGLDKHFENANKILGGECRVQTEWECKENNKGDHVPVLAGSDFEYTDYARTVLVSCD